MFSFQGFKEGWKYVEKLLLETAKSFPGVKIRAAVPISSNFNITLDNLTVHKVKLNETRKAYKRHYRSSFTNKDGYVWQQLLDKVDTPFTFVGLDLLHIDLKDVSLIRMVSTHDQQLTSNVFIHLFLRS